MMLKTWNKFVRAEDGSTAIEYGLIAALMALAIIGGIGAFGNEMDDQFDYISNIISNSRDRI